MMDFLIICSNFCLCQNLMTFDGMQTHCWYSCCGLTSTHFRSDISTHFGSDLWCHFCTSDNPI